MSKRERRREKGGGWQETPAPLLDPEEAFVQGFGLERREPVVPENALIVRDRGEMVRRNEMARKTKKMVAVEERFHQPLEKILPEMVTEQGLSHTADQLGVSKATLGYWLLKLGINVRRVALAPGETLEVKRVG